MNLTLDEIDAIGEMANISIGAAASNLGNILDEDVDISIPNICDYTREIAESTKGLSLGYEFSFVDYKIGYCVFILGGDIDDFKHMIGDHTEENAMLKGIMHTVIENSQIPIEKLLDKTISVSLYKDIYEELSFDWDNSGEDLVAITFDVLIAEHINAKAVLVYPNRLVRNFAGLFLERGIAAISTWN